MVRQNSRLIAKMPLRSWHITRFQYYIDIDERFSQIRKNPSVHKILCRISTELRYNSKYKNVGVSPRRIVKSNVSSIGPSSARESIGLRAYARNVRLYYPYRQYSNLLYFDLYLYSSTQRTTFTGWLRYSCYCSF